MKKGDVYYLTCSLFVNELIHLKVASCT